MASSSEVPAEAAALSKNRKFSFDSFLPIAALTLSLFSVYTSEVATREVARLDVIKTEYGLFHDMAQLQLQYPLMSHMFAVTGEVYDANVEQIRAASSAISKEDRLKLSLQERALAHLIFTTYEEVFYLWKQAANGDKKRAELAYDDLMYFNNVFCRNPRLRWEWDTSTGGKLGQAFARDLQDYFKDNVQKGCPTEKDPLGPFEEEKRNEAHQ